MTLTNLEIDYYGVTLYVDSVDFEAEVSFDKMYDTVEVWGSKVEIDVSEYVVDSVCIESISAYLFTCADEKVSVSDTDFVEEYLLNNCQDQIINRSKE